MMGRMTATMIGVDGGMVWADDTGGDGPPLVLLHPGVGDSRIWDPVLPGLAATYRVIRYDARGFGQSPAPTVKHSLLRDLVAVLGHYDIERAAIVGCSQGGASALGLAIEQPERVPALVLLCPGIPGFPFGEDDPDESDGLFEEYQRAEAARDVEAMASAIQRIWGRAGATPDAMDQFRSAARAALSIGDLEEEDPAVFDQLGRISVPSSLLVGDADFPPLVLADKVAAATIPGCELILVPGMDHLPPLRDPALVLQTITDTLARASWLAADRRGVSRERAGTGPFGQRVLAGLILPACGRAPDDALGGEHADHQQPRARQFGGAGDLAEQRPRGGHGDDRGEQHPGHDVA
jgi:pimeloyl-ACP methyl ester carboxylesterase